MKPSKFTIIPSGIAVTVLLLPIVFMIAGSLFTGGHFSLNNYTSVFQDNRQLNLFFRTLGIAGGATCLSLIMGFPFAFLLVRTRIPGKTIWQWIYLLPLCIPPYVHANTWIYLLGDKGILTALTMNIFNLSNPLLNPYGILGACLILSFSYYPFIILLTITSLNAMDQRLEDAAILNRQPFFVFKSVTLPMISPHILSGSVFVFIFSLFNYGVPALLRIHTYPVEIFAQFSAFYNEGKATAQAFPLLMVALLLLFFQRHFMGTRKYVSIDTASQKSTMIPLGRLKIPALILMSSIILVSVILPLSVLMYQAKSILSFKIAFQTSHTDILTTLIISMISATLIICLSFFTAELIENKKYKPGPIFDILTFIPFAFPATLVGISLIYFWNRPLIEIVYKGSLILIIAYITRFIPFSIRVMTSTLKQISPSMKEAALLYQKSWWKRLSKIHLPLTAQGISAGWVIAFVLCMGELGATLLVIPPGKGTLSLKIYTLMHYGANNIVAALALCLIGINLLISSTVILAGRYNKQFITWNSHT